MSLGVLCHLREWPTVRLLLLILQLSFEAGTLMLGRRHLLLPINKPAKTILKKNAKVGSLTGFFLLMRESSGSERNEDL